MVQVKQQQRCSSHRDNPSHYDCPYQVSSPIDTSDAFLQGALEELLGKSDHVQEGDEIFELDDSRRDGILARGRDLNENVRTTEVLMHSPPSLCVSCRSCSR